MFHANVAFCMERMPVHDEAFLSFVKNNCEFGDSDDDNKDSKVVVDDPIQVFFFPFSSME